MYQRAASTTAFTASLVLAVLGGCGGASGEKQRDYKREASKVCRGFVAELSKRMRRVLNR